jgi:hypothetical protein
MKHLKHINEFFYFGETSRLIIVEGTAPFRPETQVRIDDMVEAGELTIVDMSTCDVAEIEEAVASDIQKILFVNGDECERSIRYSVMDLHPEIIPASVLTPEDLAPSSK